MPPSKLGRLGEDAAIEHLRRSGYHILARNWRTGRSEIDVIASCGDEVVFVEVKTRRPGPQSPEEALTPAQRRRIMRAAASWMRTHRLGRTFRFDLIAVTVSRAGRLRVRHIRAAFDAHGP